MSPRRPWRTIEQVVRRDMSMAEAASMAGTALHAVTASPEGFAVIAAYLRTEGGYPASDELIWAALARAHDLICPGCSDPIPAAMPPGGPGG